MQGSELEGSGRPTWLASLWSPCSPSPPPSVPEYLARRKGASVAYSALSLLCYSFLSCSVHGLTVFWRGPGCRLEAPPAPLRGLSLPSSDRTPPFRLSSRLSSCPVARLLSSPSFHLPKTQLGSGHRLTLPVTRQLKGAFPWGLFCSLMFCDIYFFHSACPASR